jgi:hypothetical protein
MTQEGGSSPPVDDNGLGVALAMNARDALDPSAAANLEEQMRLVQKQFAIAHTLDLTPSEKSELNRAAANARGAG